ncbi:MAG: nucleotidyltransferase [Thermoprotei archaeon]|nr:MAG: nucleotidyltransferase [Thermoprotei archaeon]
MKAAILAGGMGRRLRPLTTDKPKPLVEVGGKPIIEWQILWLKKFGVDSFVILAGYRWEKLIEYLGSGAKYGVRISYSIEDEPLGTGGALKNAEHVLKSEEIFLVLNGDVITNIDPRLLIESVRSSDNVIAAIAAVPMRSPYGILKISSNDYIENFIEKPVLPEYLINAGVYALKPSIFDYLPQRGDIEKTAFPELAKLKKLRAVRYHKVYWKAIDTLKDLEEATRDIPEIFSNLIT